ncbi:response regulator [Chryseolinea sp. H1M3-3]|uniref:response regulator n=1 Tax=Chryseolinea sp. H1M3-3 TaxID=3034144 RepID=UPI0023EB5F09|nr:response regulator [Chryseolinea sp. H1M3-3]
MSDHSVLLLLRLSTVVFLQPSVLIFSAVIIPVAAVLIFLLRRISLLKNQKADLHRQVLEKSELLDYAIEKEKKLRELASEANRTKSLLLVRINHEIRTPLNGILGMTSLLAESPLTYEQQEYTDTIRECGDSLLKVVNDILLKDILDYSKLESGKVELEQKDFSLENSLEEVLDVFGGKAATSGIELLYHLDANVPAQIVGDKLRLGQVLMNLVENAIRYTRKGEILINVKLQDTGEANAVELRFEVRDTGAGIANDQLQLLLADMSNLNSTLKTERSGVGLIISKKLVELMGGSITIESQKDKGTTVIFTIRTVSSLQARAINYGLGSIEGKKILVVEDNLSHVNFIKEQLVEWKFLPVVVHAGKDALKILQQPHDIELVLIDNEVLDMNGVDLAKSIREIHPHLPLVLLSPKDEANGKPHVELFDSVAYKPIKKHLLSKSILTSFRHLSKVSTNVDTNTLSANFSEQHPLRILVAEDNATNQKLALKVLGKLGYKPDIARHGKEVLEMVSNKNYDVILMDVQMPEMDGLEASRMIRICLTVQPIIIAMTANTLQGDREACLQAGMDDYISKPIVLEDLVDILEKWAINIHEKR